MVGGLAGSMRRVCGAVGVVGQLSSSSLSPLSVIMWTETLRFPGLSYSLSSENSMASSPSWSSSSSFPWSPPPSRVCCRLGGKKLDPGAMGEISGGIWELSPGDLAGNSTEPTPSSWVGVTGEVGCGKFAASATILRAGVRWWFCPPLVGRGVWGESRWGSPPTPPTGVGVTVWVCFFVCVSGVCCDSGWLMTPTLVRFGVSSAKG